MATIYLGRPEFYRSGEGGGFSTVVGIERKKARMARYTVKAPSIGASSVSFRFIGFSGGEGTRPSKLRCYVGTSPTSHETVGPGSSYTCKLTLSGSAYTGSANLVLLPSETYYVWVYPDDFDTYGWMFWSNGSEDGRMETSGAAATDLSAGGGTLGSSHKLSLHRYSTSATHDLTASCGSVKTTIATGVKADAYNWTPPIEWASQNTSGTSVQVTITCKTKIGGSVVGSDSATVKMAIPGSVVPTCSASLSDSSGVLGELGVYVQNKSKLVVSISAKGIYGSSINAFEINVGGRKASAQKATFELPTSGNIKITAKARDTRGRWGQWTKTIGVTAYRIPRAEIREVYRCTEQGTGDMTGAFACIMFDASVDPIVADSARYTVKYRKRSEQNWSTQLLSQFNGKQALEMQGVILPADPQFGYEFAIEVKDRWPPARESQYRSCPVAFALIQIDKARKAYGFGQQAGPDNSISFGLPLLLNAPLQIGGLIPRKYLTTGDDTNHYTEQGLYAISTHEEAKQVSNLPEQTAGLLWVFSVTGSTRESGAWVYLMQVFRPLSAELPTYRRNITTSDAPGGWTYGNWYS